MALKIMRRELLSLDGSLERFRREAQAMAKISTPHVARVYEQGEDERVAWIALELIEGESLDARLRREGPLEPRAAVELLTALCLGIEAAHDQGVLHRDLKPANVMIRASDGQPLLTDFGLARASGASQQLTHTGEILGTPSYMPPEQAGAAYDVGPAADVYGLGAILYAALTGSPPFQAGTVLQVLDKVFNSAPERPSALRGEALPAELEALCLRCLAKDPRERPQTALAVRRALGGLSARPEAKRWPKALGAFALLGVVFVASAAATLATTSPGEPGRPTASPSEVASARPSPDPSPQPSERLQPSERPQPSQLPPPLEPLEPIQAPLWPAGIFGPPPAWAVALEALSPEEQLARLEERARGAEGDLRFRVLALESEHFVRPCVVGRDPPSASAELLRRGHRLYEELTAHARRAESVRPPDEDKIRLVRLFRGRLCFALAQIKFTDPSLSLQAAVADLERSCTDLGPSSQAPPPGRFGRESLSYFHLALLRLRSENSRLSRGAELRAGRALQRSAPAWAVGYVGEARGLLAAGDRASALEVIERGLAQVSPEERPLLLLWRQGQALEAEDPAGLADLEEAIRATRRPGERLLGLVELCYRFWTQQPTELPRALARLDAFVAALEGGREWSGSMVGSLRAQVLPAEQALVAASEALARGVSDPLRRAQLLALRARAHRALGHAAACERDLRASLSLQLAPAALLLELEASLAAKDSDRVELLLYRLWTCRSAPLHRERARELVEEAWGVERASPRFGLLDCPLREPRFDEALRALPASSPQRLLMALRHIEDALERPEAPATVLEQGLVLAQQALAAKLDPELELEIRFLRAKLCAQGLARRGGDREHLRGLGVGDVEQLLGRLDAHRRASLRVVHYELLWGTLRALTPAAMLRAEAALRAWCREAPLAPEAVGALANCLARLGRVGEALEILKGYRGLATPSWPQQGNLDLLHARLLRGEGRYQQACEVGRAATSLPNSSVSERLEAILELTRTLLVFEGEPPLLPLQVSSSALRFLPALAASAPEAARLAFEVPYVHAQALRCAGKSAEAQAYLRQAEDKARGQAGWQGLIESERAANLVAQGQRELGLEHLERAIELTGLATHRLARVTLLDELGRRADALAELERVDPKQLPLPGRARYRRLRERLRAARPAD